MTDIVKRDPFKSLFTFPRWIDDFDFSPSQRGLKIHEDEKDIIVEAVVAGIPSKDVEVHIEDGVLTIKAEKSEDKKEEDGYTSSSYQYYYTAALSGGQWDKAEAEVEDGILTLNIPKTEAARPRKITVRAKDKK